MSIETVPYECDRVAAVKAFNARLRKGGVTFQFYERPTPEWLPPAPGRKVYREYYLAVEGADVRGAYVLKKEQFHIFGKPHSIASWQGPISEGTVDPKFNSLGLHLVLDMVRRAPFLFGWGMQEPLPSMLRSLKWDIRVLPICVRVTRPFGFLRRNGRFRRSALRRLLSDAFAYSGIGYVSMKLWFSAQSIGWSRSTATVGIVDKFDEWADQLWDTVSPRYAFVGLRDSTALNAAFPPTESRFIRLKVSDRDRPIGWVILSTKRMQSDPTYGSLYVGTIVDCLSLPERARVVIQLASRHLEDCGVDLVLSNQTHPAWIDAFSKAGFAILPRTRVFAASKKLSRLLQQTDPGRTGMHLTFADCDGPLGL